MPRPKLTTPHVCGTPGCGAPFTRGGRVKPTPACPRCYTRERRKLPAMPAPAVPSVRLHVSLPVDTSQRLSAFVLAGPFFSASEVIDHALVAFFDRLEAQSAAAAREQGKRR